MLESGNYLQPTVGFAPFHEKPPLFAWFQAASFGSWGVGPRGARFPNVLCGLLTLLLLAVLGDRVRPGLGRWWAAFLGLSLLPFLYFRSGIIDPWFNLFILLGLWPTLTADRRWEAHLLAGVVLGLAVLTKGPAAGLIAGLCWAALLILRPSARGERAARYLTTGMLALIPIALWLAFLWQQDQGYFAREFLNYQWRLFFREDAGHGGFPGYHAVVLLFGCFPAGVFALPALLRHRHFDGPVDRGMRVLFWVVLLLFSVVNTKIVHYSSLAYFPLAWFAVRGLRTGHLRKDWRRIRDLTTGVWASYALVSLAVPVLVLTLSQWLPLVTDPELTARLKLAVEWPRWTFLPGIIAIAGALVSSRSRLSPLRYAALQLVLTALFCLFALPAFAPRIQQYTQGELVAFFTGLRGQDVYYGTAYHKSYAHWFYGRVQPDVYQNGCHARQCRFHGPINKPLYFSSPLRRTEQVLREVPDAELLYSRGGFSFYRRPPMLPE